VGLAAIQMANAVGAVPIATTRNPNKEAALQDAGAAFVVNTKNNKWPERVREITSGRGVDLAFDPVVGPELERVADTVRTEGTIFVYGALSPEPTPFPLFAAMRNELKDQRERSGAKAADEVDKATDAYDEDLSFEIATANDQELQELQVALDKIDKGTYGLCEGCQCPISASRLRVLPFATACVSCRGQEEQQRLHEEEGANFNLLGEEPEIEEPEA